MLVIAVVTSDSIPLYPCSQSFFMADNFLFPPWQSCSRSPKLCSKEKSFFNPQCVQNIHNILNFPKHHGNKCGKTLWNWDLPIRHSRQASSSICILWVSWKQRNSGLTSVTRETGSDGHTSQSKPLKYNHVLVEILEDRSNLFLCTWSWEGPQDCSYQPLSPCHADGGWRSNQYGERKSWGTESHQALGIVMNLEMQLYLFPAPS